MGTGSAKREPREIAQHSHINEFPGSNLNHLWLRVPAPLHAIRDLWELRVAFRVPASTIIAAITLGFTYMFSCIHPNNLRGWGLFFPFYTWRNWGSERLHHFPRVTQPGPKPRNPDFKDLALPAILYPPPQMSCETLLQNTYRNAIYFVDLSPYPTRIQSPWRRYVSIFCLLPHSPAPTIVPSSQKGLNKCMLNEWMNKRSELAVGLVFWLLVFCSLPIVPLPPLAHSQTAPYNHAHSRFFVGPEVRGTRVWIPVSPLANCVNEASYIMCFSWFPHL